MVTAVTKKMNRNSSTTTTTTTTTIIAKKILEASVSGSSSSASGFRLLIEANGGLSNRYSGSGSGGRSSGLDQCETMSTVSKCSVYKQRIDAMFDDSKSIISQRSLRDRKRAPSANGSISGSNRLSSERLQAINENEHNNGSPTQTITNSVQAQIEKMFTDVAKDDPNTISTCFQIKCLGSLPLIGKVTSLLGLQDPLRQLYLSGAGHGNQNAGTLDISPKGLRVRQTNGRESQLTPFQNIAVWSAVKFVVSQTEGGAAFLPLITDPDNIDKGILFKPLSAADKRRLSSGLHSPLFAVVMKSPSVPKQLECHGFVCQSPEDAIVIAATLYQNLMAHMGNSQNQRSRKPKNRNGIGCMSIASSSAVTNALISSKSSFRRSHNGSTSRRGGPRSGPPPPPPPPSRPPRKKRSASSSLSGDSDEIIHNINSIGSNKGHHHQQDYDSSTEERDKKKNSKPKKPPPLPLNPPNLNRRADQTNSLSDKGRRNNGPTGKSKSSGDQKSSNKNNNINSNNNDIDPYSLNDGSSGDILTKVAIPRSGSFLNTAGLTRYKSRATRRNLTGKAVNGGAFTGGGGGSPLGFSELFNEFRLQENLHSLDEILNAIINSDGMSFNDLKPIYKEFLLKLAVTLTKDELYQRSKSIMRRQKKKKLKRKASSVKNHRTKMIIGAIGLKNVFKFKSKKPPVTAVPPKSKQGDQKSEYELKSRNKRIERSRIGTSGSEVSVHRNETAMNAHNRNSSSGYVSCSECSYDSDNCTCNSADRCYCSLGGDEMNAKLNRAQAQRRSSIPSCHSEDKCYCSMGETNEGSTTWCDSDSCDSKCYCTPEEKLKSGKHNKSAGKSGHKKGKSMRSRNSDNLALDYELFTVGGNGRHVKPTEALSVKKSVEMAAVFADVKLSQTTDITNLKPTKDKKHQKQRHHHKNSHTHELILSNNNNSNNLMSKSISRNIKSNNDEFIFQSNTSSELILRKDIEISSKRMTKTESYYQAISPRPVSASLEDSLGYLP